MKPSEATQRGAAAPASGCGKPEPPLEIDLDRLVYDPEYRSQVRERLNRPRQPVRDDPKGGSPD